MCSGGCGEWFCRVKWGCQQELRTKYSNESLRTPESPVLSIANKSIRKMNGCKQKQVWFPLRIEVGSHLVMA